MRNYPNVTTISVDNNFFPHPLTNLTWKDQRKDQQDIIRIDDIKDISIQGVEKLYGGVATSGASISLSPSVHLSKQTAISAAFSILLAAFVSTWVHASFLLSMFLALSFINLITSIFFDTAVSFKKKIQIFGMDLFYVGFLTTIADILLNNIQVPFLDTQSFYVGTIAFLMSINYIILISRRCFPLTSLSGSKTVLNLAKAFQIGKDKFFELQERDSIDG